MTISDTQHPEKRSVTSLSVLRSDRYTSFLSVVVIVGLVGLGLLLRRAQLSSSSPFSDREAGIQTFYPAGWLLDTQGDYLMRVSDPAARPFKTSYQITISPASAQTSVRNVLDNLTLQRSSQLAAYQVLSIQQVSERVTRMDFAFVDSDPNPFLERLPVVVLGTDLVVIDGSRAIVVTFIAADEVFEREFPRFQRFFTAMNF